MLSTVIDFGVRNAVFGGLSYVFCRAFSQSNPLEKAVLMTILVGLRELAEKAIQSKYPAKTPFREFLAHFISVDNSILKLPIISRS